MKTLLFFLLFTLVWSCSEMDQANQLEAINRMNVSLDSIQEALLEHEIDTISALSVATNAVELRIKNNYYADTIDMELGKKMDAYKIMRRTLGPLGRSFQMIKNGVIEEKATLESLKSDIENGNGEREKYPEYLQFEKKKVGQLKILLEDYISQKKETMRTYKRLHNELDSFSMVLLYQKKDIKTNGRYR